MVTKLLAVFGVGALVGFVLVGGLFGTGAGGAPAGSSTTTIINCQRTISGPTSTTSIVTTTTAIETGSCAELKVTKVVTGTVPPRATFPVVVDCAEVAADELPEANFPPFTQTLTFPAGGGMQSIFIGTGAACTITETPTAHRCALVSINPPTVDVTEPVVYPVTVTNNCEVAAEAVAAVPTFTG